MSKCTVSSGGVRLLRDADRGLLRSVERDRRVWWELLADAEVSDEEAVEVDGRSERNRSEDNYDEFLEFRPPLPSEEW